jgi:hypothetical protein
MKAADRAHRNLEIMLARAGGATYPQLANAFELSERQVTRIVEKLRRSRPVIDLESAHRRALRRRGQLLWVLEKLMQRLNDDSDLFTVFKQWQWRLVLDYFKEVREIDELLGLIPREIDWRFKREYGAELWLRFKGVIARHPGAWDELYDDLVREYASWVERLLEREARNS